MNLVVVWSGINKKFMKTSRLVLYTFLVISLIVIFIKDGFPKNLSGYKIVSLIIFLLMLVFLIYSSFKKSKD